MVVEGHCNCGSIRVNLPSLPSRSVVCYWYVAHHLLTPRLCPYIFSLHVLISSLSDNCQRSSAGLCSTNYMVEKTDVDIKDPHGYLKNYKDGNTKSNSVITRQFCGNCGW
jgi:hypothetical protein